MASAISPDHTASRPSTRSVAPAETPTMRLKMNSIATVEKTSSNIKRPSSLVNTLCVNRRRSDTAVSGV